MLRVDQFRFEENRTAVHVKFARDVLPEAEANARAWFAKQVGPKLARIGSQPEFVTAAKLESRRADALAQLDGLNEQIEAVRKSCLTGVLAEEGSGAAKAAIAKIESLKRDIEATTLVLNALDNALPDACAARERAGKTVIDGIVDAAHRDLSKEEQSNDVFFAGVQKLALAYFTVERKYALVDDVIRRAGDYVVEAVDRHSS